MAEKIFQIPHTDSRGIIELLTFLEKKELPLIVWSNDDAGEKVVGWGRVLDAKEKLLVEAKNFVVRNGESLFLYLPGAEVACKVTVLAIPFESQFITEMPAEIKFFASYEGSTTHVRQVKYEVIKPLTAFYDKVLIPADTREPAAPILKELMNLKGINQKLGEVLKLLSGSDIEKPTLEKLGNKVEVENEAKFLHMRTAPRSKPKGDQLITIRKRKNETEGESEYLLYDLSQGGMAFRIYDPVEFEVSEKIYVVAMSGKPLSQPLVGLVRSVRALPDEISEYKVGVQFIKEF